MTIIPDPDEADAGAQAFYASLAEGALREGDYEWAAYFGDVSRFYADAIAARRNGHSVRLLADAGSTGRESPW